MSYGMGLRPFQGGRFCGDQIGVWQGVENTLICLVDGLGHGEQAEIAAKAAIGFVENNTGLPLRDIFRGCDETIRETRGVAMALASVSLVDRELKYAAIGNTRAAIAGMSETYLGGVFGIVGEGISDPVEETHEFTRKHTLYMWSDGMPDTLNFRKYRSIRGPDLESLVKLILDENNIDGDDDGSLVAYRKD